MSTSLPTVTHTATEDQKPSASKNPVKPNASTITPMLDLFSFATAITKKQESPAACQRINW
ncbi:MAG: hypothetical protein OXI63_03940 [Candidatus Poribacteria bacterium]|nr:hypothetical protein [Candidatus Poribacteria bacterium]